MNNTPKQKRAAAGTVAQTKNANKPAKSVNALHLELNQNGVKFAIRIVPNEKGATKVVIDLKKMRVEIHPHRPSKMNSVTLKDAQPELPLFAEVIPFETIASEIVQSTERHLDLNSEMKHAFGNAS